MNSLFSPHCGAARVCAAFFGCVASLALAASAGTTTAIGAPYPQLTSPPELFTQCLPGEPNGDMKPSADETTVPGNAGYIVEFAGPHKGAFPAAVKSTAAAPKSAAPGAGVVSSVPVPSAALLFPLCLALAAYATRRMKRRAN